MNLLLLLCLFHPLNLIQTYEINLDKPPRERWAKLLTDKQKEIMKIKNYIDGLILKIPFVGTFIHNSILKSKYFLFKFDHELQQEILSASDHTNISVGYLVLLNMIFEFTTSCTSLVATDKNGEQIFGRNLDFGILGYDFTNRLFPLTDLIRNITVITKFYKGGKHFYTTISAAGFFGAITGVKPGYFAGSLNQRDEITKQWPGIISGLMWLFFGSTETKMAAHALRHALEKSENYAQFKKYLTDVKLIAPCYYIVGSVDSKEGAILTKKSEGTDVLNMKDGRNPGYSWYVIQTNYDLNSIHIIPDDRPKKAYEYMDEMTQQNLNYTNLMKNVLSRIPLTNKLTIYSVVIDIKHGIREFQFQYCVTDDCPLY